MSLLQNLIYYFNEDDVRDNVMNNVINENKMSNKIKWEGTIICKEYNKKTILQENGESISHFFLNWKHKTKIKIFTVAFVYRENLIHYVAFIFYPKTKKLICFDPGYNIYLYGSYKIIPFIVNLFYKLGWIENDIILKTKCSKKYFNTYYGLQFNGNSPLNTKLPADAFCQMWTLFFLKTFIEKNQTLEFFDEWCSILPSKREYFVIEYFLICVLKKDKKMKKYIPFLKNIILNFKIKNKKL
jgi:hypothetical protein